MAKIMKFPTLVKSDQSCMEKDLTREEILDALLRIVWKDSDTFFALENSCITARPVNDNPKAASKLRDLKLIDGNNYPPSRVRSIVLSITNYQGHCFMP